MAVKRTECPKGGEHDASVKRGQLGPLLLGWYMSYDSIWAAENHSGASDARVFWVLETLQHGATGLEHSACGDC